MSQSLFASSLPSFVSHNRLAGLGVDARPARLSGMDARRVPRIPRSRSITIFPATRAESADAAEMAWLSDVSTFGLGFQHDRPMGKGREFIVRLDLPEGELPLLFKVAHCQAIRSGKYKVGAQLVRVMNGQADAPPATAPRADDAALVKASVPAWANVAAAPGYARFVPVAAAQDAATGGVYQLRAAQPTAPMAATAPAAAVTPRVTIADQFPVIENRQERAAAAASGTQSSLESTDLVLLADRQVIEDRPTTIITIDAVGEAAIAAMDGKLAAAAKNESTIGAADAGELVTAPAAPATTAITLYESPAPEASAVVTDIVHVRPEAPGAVDAASTARVADAVEAPVATIAAEEQAIAEERVATTAVAADEVIGAGAARGAGEADAAHVSLVVLNVAGVDRDPITPTEGSGPVEAVTTSGTAIASGADAGEIDIVAEPVIVPASDTIVEAAGDAERVARASEAFELTIAAVKANEVSDTTAAAGGTHEAINAAAASNIEAAAVSMTGEARDVAEVAAADNVGVAATIMAETSEQSTTVEANNAGEAIANVDAAREVIGSERSDDAGEASVTTLVEVIEGPTADGGREVVLATIDPSTAAVGEPIRLVPFEQVVAEIADDAWTGDTFFLRGTTKCGLERRLELRREQGRTWLRIGAPGKPTGWGMYVEAAELLKAVNARPAAGEDEQRMSMAA